MLISNVYLISKVTYLLHLISFSTLSWGSLSTYPRTSSGLAETKRQNFNIPSPVQVVSMSRYSYVQDLR